jgi:hypothetical protein
MKERTLTDFEVKILLKTIKRLVKALPTLKGRK